MRPIIPLHRENSPVKPSSRILTPKVKKATRRWERAGKPKSRSGCGTCKIRKVKCDETKPICSRCANGKFDCDGYADHKTDASLSPSGPSAENVSPETNVSHMSRAISPSSLGSCTPPTSEPSHSCTSAHVACPSLNQELTHGIVYFEYFRHYANLSNGVFHYSESFCNAVLQESLQDECMRNAIFAIGSFLYGEFLLSQPGTQTNIIKQHRQESLQFYKSALTTFHSHLQDSNPITGRWILYMTPLLAIYALLRGDFDGADRLLGCALDLLRPSVDIIQSLPTWNSNVFGYTSMQVGGDSAPFFTMASRHKSQEGSNGATVLLIRDTDLSFHENSDASFNSIPYTDQPDQLMHSDMVNNWSTSPVECDSIDPQLRYDVS